MSFNNNANTDLSRYSIGEIVDLAGVANFYNAGSSKWLRSGVATASSNLSVTSRANLAAAGTSDNPTVLAQSALSTSYNTAGFYATYPIARISASQVSVVPAYYQGTTAVGVGVVTSAGLQAVSTGQTSIRTSNVSTGTNAVVASNNTTIFSYCFSSTTALSASSTTNGTTWTVGTVTGTPTFLAATGTIAYASQTSGTTYTAALTTGWKRAMGSANGQLAVFWCGARFLLLAPGAGGTNYVASLSTDGLAWGGDNTTSVLGGTAQAATVNLHFYRNGNNCYLNVGNSYRYTTDGGVTWADSTFAAAPNPSTYIMQYNTTDPAKLVLQQDISDAVAYYTADSGATWSASRPFPFATPNGGLYYKGSTLIASNGSTLYSVSTNDGVTWVTPTFPVGVLGVNLKVFADANRFYAGVRSQPQILTSSDAVTWTIVTLSQNFNTGTIATQAGMGILPFDSDTVLILGYNDASGANQAVFTNNGGVTWTISQYTVDFIGGQWGVGNAFLTPDGGGVGFAKLNSGLTTQGNSAVLKADITGGGAFYQTGSTAITPIRTGALSYVRVG